MLFSPGPSGRLAAGGRASGGGLAPQQAQPAAAGPGALGALEAPRPRSGAEETRLLRVTKKKGPVDGGFLGGTRSYPFKIGIFYIS